jgi:hypothetical protein
MRKEPVEAVSQKQPENSIAEVSGAFPPLDGRLCGHALPWERINSIMTEMQMLTGKAKRCQTIKPEGKIVALSLTNDCQTYGCAQTRRKW